MLQLHSQEEKKIVFNINLFTTALLCKRNPSLGLNESAL